MPKPSPNRHQNRNHNCLGTRHGEGSCVSVKPPDVPLKFERIATMPIDQRWSIYLLRNTVTGKGYVGQTRNELSVRLKEHRKQARKSCPFGSALSHAIRGSVSWFNPWPSVWRSKVVLHESLHGECVRSQVDQAAAHDVSERI
jgi:hypothetical protein